MLEKVVGCSVRDYLIDKLWQPLGTRAPRWDSDPAGHTFPTSDLFLDIRDMIKLSQIYLGKGMFEGHRYLSEDWVIVATQNHVTSDVINPTGEVADEHCGYGYYFWMNSVSGTYRPYGREGQFIIVLPEQEAVVAVQAMHHDV